MRTMRKITVSLGLRRASAGDADRAWGGLRNRQGQRRSGIPRILGIVLLALAALLAWKSHWFHAEADLSRYPEIQLTYTTCRFERIRHSKGSTTKQIAFITENGRYVMEDGVWRRHFDGPALADALSGGGTVRAWIHPEYPHALRGIKGGKVDIPPEWGLAYDQRNMGVGIIVDAVLALSGVGLLLWKR
jgi:hypothetical protein